jgi:hypothetical protein
VREEEKRDRAEVVALLFVLSCSQSLRSFSLCHKKNPKTENQGCVACLSLIFRDGQQQGAALCPLCRAPFSRVPAPNHELRELVSLAAALAPHRGGGSSSDDGEGWEEGGGGGGGGGATSDDWTDVARPGQILMRRKRSNRRQKSKGSSDEDEEGEEEGGGEGRSPLLALAAFPLPSASSASPSRASSLRLPLPLHRVTVGTVRAGLADPWDLEPPASWEPDSASPACACCGAAFAGLVIGGGGGGRGRSGGGGGSGGGGSGAADLSASTSSSSSSSASPPSSSAASTAISGLRTALAVATALATTAASAARAARGSSSGIGSRRHHCRVCGGLFCSSCTRWRVVPPPRFARAGASRRARACGACAALLQPTQARAAASLSASAQPPVRFLFLKTSPLSQNFKLEPPLPPPKLKNYKNIF